MRDPGAALRMEPNALVVAEGREAEERKELWPFCLLCYPGKQKQYTFSYRTIFKLYKYRL